MAKTIYWYEYRPKKKQQMVLKKSFFKLIHNAVFIKTIEIVINHRHIDLVTKERRRNYLISEPKYQVFHGTNISNRNKKQRYL